MNHETFDADLYQIDWTDVPERTKQEIIKQHLSYVTLSRRVENASGAYIANLRSLMISMLISLAMVIRGAENRKILLAVISFQFAKTFLSRLFEANLFAALDIAKKDFASFLNRKLKL
jgi:hypothetical protein